MKLKLNDSKTAWIELEPNSKDPESIYLDGYLKQKLDNVKNILKKGWDCVILIDGAERSGKSTLGMTIAHYLTNGAFSISNITSGFESTKKLIRDCPDGSTIISDESSMVFNTKDANKRENVELQKILDVVGQKNLTLILILPCFFDLNKSIACRRSRFLLHVYTNEKLDRGSFAYFGTHNKSMLYEIGKKNFNSYSKPHPEFQGAFTDFKPTYYEEYLKLKRKSLIEALNITATKKPISALDIKMRIAVDFRKHCPEVSIKTLCRGFGIGATTFYRWEDTLAVAPLPVTDNIICNPSITKENNNEEGGEIVRGD